ncbi:Phenylalanine-4-hydroxylase [Smittium culicis]|uniref:phenylalanine 4-monooxygenase n=1 Tax=Smittium culicis TaxID=133412 RepID=A0A1R1YHL9_9FUNG|nr:Phenylalanine-4-hydroxylase [Smittium culicis]
MIPAVMSMQENPSNLYLDEKDGCPSSRSDTTSKRATLFFSISDTVGGLDNCLQALREEKISLTRIESRPSKAVIMGYDFFVDLNESRVDSIISVVEKIKQIPIVKEVHLVRGVNEDLEGVQEDSDVIWFPRKKRDLDTFSEKVLEMGSDLPSDHPGALDKEYRKRRYEITQLAKKHKTGMPLPHIEYTPEERQTWKSVYNNLKQSYQGRACAEFLNIFPLLESNCGYSPDSIPQIEDVSKFLKDCTGFTIRPVMGLLSSRDFLNAFAFRVFHSTQYIRHGSKPLYTPEPDVCHELLGHVPLLAVPDFAEFCHEIGLASLGVSDSDINKLATFFWFTVEFGLCKNDKNELRAYGAGLLSSSGELEYSLSGKPELKPLSLTETPEQEYPITEYQPLYFVSESFKDATNLVRQFASSMDRKFNVRYNPYTETVEVLDNKERINQFAIEIRNNMQILTSCLLKS